ncbi:triple gene block 1 [Yam virus X]|uniref:Triple gene block 1 n=1 Tax=Yam virus X TaxID=1503864 RepID=A0A096XLM0_9VIRU|nr:triple gene block 1 [Yam virus X]AIB00370.1 triple gene block 1 [Yam virus X]
MSNFRTNIVELFTAQGFERTSLPISTPIVIHGVAGSGKTRILEDVLDKFPVSVYSNIPKPKRFNGRNFTEKIAGALIVDEYQLGFTDDNSILVGDCFQPGHISRPAHFLSLKSFRFGSVTAQHLSNILGLPVVGNSEIQDKIEVLPLFEAELEGAVFCSSEDTCNLLESHQVKHYHKDCVQGATFNTVTVVAEDRELSSLTIPERYVLQSRHRQTLRILCP